jgi:hypothetical protein
LVELRTLLVALCVSGCVAGAEKRPSSAETAAGAPPVPAEPSAGSVLAGATKTAPDPEPGTPPSPDSVWVRGYWHWTGVRYTWIPAHWERRSTPYAPSVGR